MDAGPHTDVCNARVVGSVGFCRLIKGGIVLILVRLNMILIDFNMFLVKSDIFGTPFPLLIKDRSDNLEC